MTAYAPPESALPFRLNVTFKRSSRVNVTFTRNEAGVRDER